MPSLLKKLKAGIKNEKRVMFPGIDKEVTLRVLTNAEVQEAAFETEKLFKREGITFSVSTSEAYEKEYTLQMLHRALLDPGTGKPAAATVEELKSLTTQAEKDVLVEELLALMEECSPNLDNMPEEQYVEILAEVKKTPEAAQSFSSIRLLRRLVVSLASPPASSQTGSGSTS